jgi:predicted nucleotidyltransferase
MAQKTKLALKKEPLSHTDAQALQAFAKLLQQSYPDLIRQVFLFGSKARGEGLPDSDIDVLIITVYEDRALRHAIIDLASNCSLEYGVLLSPRIISMERWRAKQGFGFYRNIARDAKPISVGGIST